MLAQDSDQLLRLGSLLKEARRRLHRTAKDVAQDAGITPTYLWMLETGTNPKTGRPARPSADVLVRLAETLEIERADIFTLAGYPDLASAATATARRSGAATPRRPAPPFDGWLLGAPDPLVGRATELQKLSTRLHPDRPSVVAITGLAGIGKTALAATIARQLHEENRFPGGIAVVLCQGLTASSDVLRRVLARFDPARHQPDATDLSALGELAQRLLRGTPALVVLDDVVPDVPVADVVAPLRAAGASLLLTARHRLPAAAVSIADTLPLELLSQAEALELFALARGHTGADTVAEADTPSAERIVNALGCHTLAVRLAGTYAANAQRDLAALAEELEDPLRKVALPDGDTPSAVQQAFEQSIQALPENAQQLFASLAVFQANEFGRGALSALGTALRLDVPERAIDLLVLRALINATTNGTMPAASDRERLRLHPLLQALSLVRFNALSDERRDTMQLAIAQYYATYTQRLAASELSHAEINRAIEQDEPNVIGALEWAHQRGHLELVVALCSGVQRFWRDRGSTRASLKYLLWGVSAAEQQLGDPANPDPARADTLFWLQLNLGYAYQSTGALRKATHLYERAHFLACQSHARRNEGAALSRLAQIYHARGQLEEARDHLERSLAIRREVEDRRGEGQDLRLLSQIAQHRGKLDDAERYLQRSLAIARDLDDAAAEGTVLANLGRLARDRGKLDDAERCLNRSLMLARDVGNRLCEGTVLRHLGRVARDRGRIEEAKERFEESRVIAEEMEDIRGKGTILAQLGRLEFWGGRLDEAEKLLRQALDLARRVQDAHGEGLCLAELGLVAQVRGQLNEAERRYETAEDLFERAGARRDTGRVLSRLGQVAQLRGRLRRAEQLHNKALAIHREVQDLRGEGIDLANLGQVAHLRGNLSLAASYYDQSLAIAREVQDRRGEGIVLSHLGWLAQERGELNQAEDYYRTSQAICREVMDRHGESAILAQLGWLMQSRGELDAAERYYKQYLERARELNDRRAEGAALSQMGWLAQARGQLDEAEAMYRQSLAIRREVQDERGEATDLARLGRIAMRRREYPLAEEYGKQALELDRKVLNQRGEGIDLSRLGQVAAEQRHVDEARQYFETSLAIRREVEDRYGEGIDLARLGQIAQECGQPEEAERYYQESLRLRRDVQDRRGEAEVLFLLARLRESLNELDEAERLFRESLALRRQVGIIPDLADSLRGLGTFLVERRARTEQGQRLIVEAQERSASTDLPNEDDLRPDIPRGAYEV